MLGIQGLMVSIKKNNGDFIVDISEYIDNITNSAIVKYAINKSVWGLD